MSENSNIVVDLSSYVRSLTQRLPSYVSVEFSKNKMTWFNNSEYPVNHYPIDFACFSGKGKTEADIIINIQEALEEILVHQVNNVLFKGIFSSNCYGDVDWNKELNVKRVKLLTDEVEDYFSKLGFTDLYFAEIVLPVKDMGLDERPEKSRIKVVFPNNLDIIRVVFAPANRFSTVNTKAKSAYLFKYQNDKEDMTEYMGESNFLVILDKPELIVEVIDVY